MDRLLPTSTVLSVSGLSARQVQYLFDQGRLGAAGRKRGCRREFTVPETAALVIAGELQQRPDTTSQAVLKVFPSLLNCCREIAKRAPSVYADQWILIDWYDSTVIRPEGLLGLARVAEQRQHPVTILDAAISFRKIISDTNSSKSVMNKQLI